MLKNKAHETNEIVSLSGTSGGAICAALAWQGLVKWQNGERGSLCQGLESFWRDNGTEDFTQQFLNTLTAGYLRLVEHGYLPEFKQSPYSPWPKACIKTLQFWKPGFYDFRHLLESHIKFEEIGGRVKLFEAPCENTDNISRHVPTPLLVIGAADVKSGEFRKFIGTKNTIDNKTASKGDNSAAIDALLASAAVPSIFKAVEIGDGVYWDGLFSDNPPTDELIDEDIVGKNNIPDQLWVIQINPRECDAIPETIDKITDRRNEMISNATLFKDLQHIFRGYFLGYDDELGKNGILGRPPG